MPSPLVEQFRKGGVSRDVRLTAASGELPLKPVDQVDLLHLLSRDADQEVRVKAEASLLAIPLATLHGVLKDSSIHPKALDFYGGRLESKEALQAIIQNSASEDVTIQALAARVSTELLELIVINQVRLLRHPPIIDSLIRNASLSSDQQRRLSELKHDFKLGQPAPVELAPASAETYLDLGAGPPEEEEPLSLEQALIKYGEPEEGLSDKEKEDRRTRIRELSTMNAAKKMMRALKGDREERMILIRERNRIVWAAVLNSPKLTESDIEQIAQMKNVSADVLSNIGANGQWTKRYSIKRELVKNPVTPPHVSLRLLPHLAVPDLKRIANDRNVAEPIRRKAREMTKHQK